MKIVKDCCLSKHKNTRASQNPALDYIDYPWRKATRWPRHFSWDYPDGMIKSQRDLINRPFGQSLAGQAALAGWVKNKRLR